MVKDYSHGYWYGGYHRQKGMHILVSRDTGKAYWYRSSGRITAPALAHATAFRGHVCDRFEELPYVPVPEVDRYGSKPIAIEVSRDYDGWRFDVRTESYEGSFLIPCGYVHLRYKTRKQAVEEAAKLGIKLGPIA